MDSELTQDEIEAKLKEFQKWIDEQPDMPKKFEKLLLLRYLKISRWRVEKAQKILRSTLTLRTENPQIFSDRDPLSTEMQDVFESLDMFPLSFATAENLTISVSRLTSDEAADAIDFNDVIKALFMISDVRLIMPDPTPKLSDGEIAVFDMQHVSYRHLTKIVLSTMRLYFRYIQEANPVRIRQIHIINCSPIIDKITALIKPFVRAEHYQLINFHTPGSDTLFAYVPREAIPNEMGGTAGQIKEMKQKFIEQVVKQRLYLMDDDIWRLIREEKEEETGGGVLDFLGVF